MGLIHAELSLRNPRETGLVPIEVRALVDTGSLHLCIPEHVALQLRLEKLYEREVTIADGGKRLCPYVGPLEVHFDGRACFTGALVLGDEVLLGAVPMEDMDLVVHPSRQEVIVNPDSPNIPSSTAKSARQRLSSLRRIFSSSSFSVLLRSGSVSARRRLRLHLRPS